VPEPWWKTSVAYQIYPRSFCDTGAGVGGAGVGDLEGIRRHLDHLAWLGVDAIWLSPFFPSPMRDYGYDVADFCGVDPLFGDLDAFDALLGDAHALGLRVIIDWVPNHTSDQHPWFAASRRSRDDPQRDWYVWRDPAPDGGPPNNWVESLTMGPAWTLDETTGQYYLHCFLPEQPDLNWANDAVVDAMGSTLRFWLDRGVDGFRMDVVHLIGKDPTLPDDPPELAGLPHVVLNSRPETHDHLRGIRKLLDSYDGDRVAVGEVYLLDTDLVAEHYGHDDELHLCFNFPPLYAAWDAATWRAQIERTAAALDPRDAWPTWVLSNHDNPRHATRYGSEARARAAAVLLLTLRGTPFLYAGEELGLLDAEVPDDRRRDPAGRDGCRAPVPWDAAATHGWNDAEPWLPWPPHADVQNVATLRDDPASILHLYRTLLALRKATPELRVGDLEVLDGPDGVLAYRRTVAAAATAPVTVAINFSGEPIETGLAGELLVSSIDTARGAFSGTLAADEAVVLR
jgi:alpha-glucosidase